jgi:hypothetical protein
MKVEAVRLKAETIQFSYDVLPKSPAIQGKALAILINRTKRSVPREIGRIGTRLTYMVESRV